MAKTSEMQNFYHRLMELKDDGYNVDIELSHKNCAIYTISKENGNAKYQDCVIMYNGDEDEENSQPIDDIDFEELMERLEEIVKKIDSVL